MHIRFTEGLMLRHAAPIEPVEPPDFETDARILRGVWTGADERGHRLLIDANASAPNNCG